MNLPLRFLFSFAVSTMLSFCVWGYSHATDVDNQLIDAIDDLVAEKEGKDLVTLQDSLSFDSFSSCEDMTTTLEAFIQEHFKDGRGHRRGGGVWFGDDIAMMDMEEAASDGAPVPMLAKSTNQAGDADESIQSSTNDFSTTNLQVAGVDEADILKTDGKYLYYYNDKEKKISILRSPLDLSSSTITLDDAEVVKEIRIPKTFWGTELYLADDTLVILAQRWSQNNTQGLLNKNSRTNVVVYNISDVTDPKLVKLSDLDGSYHDSRMIGDQLYVVSDLQMNRRYPSQVYTDIADVDIAIDEILPKTIDIAYTKNEDDRNLRIGDTNFPYRVAIDRPDCENIHYVLPSKESMDEYNLYPSFTVVRSIDIADTTDEVQTHTAFGSTQTIHMSEQGLYLTSPFYAQRAFSCPVNARCIMPWYDPGQHTLIHKFTIDTNTVEYVASNLVQGSPLSQYSMSEDSHGFFRILTSTWDPQLATHLSVLDDDLELEGVLLNIEPGEEFKSSRYIGDKLYLVTFERTDPLFVIDLEKTNKPKIIGELKIPGYSSYLHPYAKAANGKQYLLGLGYATTENQRGGIVTNGVKLDLYEIDYNEIDNAGQVSTKQLYTETWGEKNSYSEALENPRMFVWDEKRKLVVLPMILSDTEKAQNCNVQYDNNGLEIGRECRDNEQVDTTFAGLKAIEVDIDSGITERYSYNFLEKLTEELQENGEIYESRDGSIYPWQFQQMNFRVGYLGDVLYTLNNAFAHFTVMDTDNEKYVDISN